MYRPDGWAHKRSKFFESKQAVNRWGKTRQLDYEAGSDAMLDEFGKLDIVEILKILAEYFPDRYVRLGEDNEG